MLLEELWSGFLWYSLIFMICHLSGRIVMGLFGKAVPKTVGMIVFYLFWKHWNPVTGLDDRYIIWLLTFAPFILDCRELPSAVHRWEFDLSLFPIFFWDIPIVISVVYVQIKLPTLAYSASSVCMLCGVLSFGVHHDQCIKTGLNTISNTITTKCVQLKSVKYLGDTVEKII